MYNHTNSHPTTHTPAKPPTTHNLRFILQQNLKRNVRESKSAIRKYIPPPQTSFELNLNQSKNKACLCLAQLSSACPYSGDSTPSSYQTGQTLFRGNIMFQQVLSKTFETFLCLPGQRVEICYFSCKECSSLNKHVPTIAPPQGNAV